MVPKELQDAREAYHAVMVDTERLLRAPRGDGGIPPESVESVAEALLAQLQVSDALMVPLLTAMTAGVSAAAEVVGPCILALRIGMELDFARPDLGRLALASLLYEIGRGRAPRGGNAAGLRRVVEEQGQPWRQRGPLYADVADLVLRIHDGLGDAGPVSERPGTDEAVHVVGLAIAYHDQARQRATTERSWPPRHLKEVLRRHRARFPDNVLRALIRGLTTLPLGALVRLNSGEIGYVVAKNEGVPLRPVLAVWVSLGKLLAEPKPVDLQRHPFLFVEEFLGEDKLR